MNDKIEPNPEERITLIEYLHEAALDVAKDADPAALLPMDVAMANMIADLLSMEVLAARARKRAGENAAPYPFFEIRVIDGEVSLIWKLAVRRDWEFFVLKHSKLLGLNALSKLFESFDTQR